MDNGLYTRKFSDYPITGKVYGYYGKDDEKLTKVYIGELVKGKKEGIWKFWYHDTGLKSEEIHYKNNDFDGLWTKWDENGRKKWEWTYKDGERDGISTHWYENGEKLVETWKDEHWDGKFTYWYRNGQKKQEETWKHYNGTSKRVGISTDWYENGQKMMERTYKDGKEDGLATGWHENGQKSREIIIKDGKPDGLGTMWYENGQKKEEVTFKDGESISQNCWDKNGNECECSENWLYGCK